MHQITPLRLLGRSADTDQKSRRGFNMATLDLGLSGSEVRALWAVRRPPSHVPPFEPARHRTIRTIGLASGRLRQGLPAIREAPQRANVAYAPGAHVASYQEGISPHWRHSTLMADTLVQSLGSLVQERKALRRKEQQLAQRQLQLIKEVGQLLRGVGYQLKPWGNVKGTTSASGVIKTQGRKHFKCPKCDRRFAHRLPLARHVSASHPPKKQKRVGKKGKTAKKN